MTKLEAIEKNMKLPKLKDGYYYIVYSKGQVVIDRDERPYLPMILFTDFVSYSTNNYYCDVKVYKQYFETPIYKNGEIVGYE